MLVRLMYASRAAEPIKPETLNAILKKSTAHNPDVGVTGVLCFSGDVYLQVLEGGRPQVSTLYNRIARDPRHHDVVLLGELNTRAYGDPVDGFQLLLDAARRTSDPQLFQRTIDVAVQARSLAPCQSGARAARSCASPSSHSHARAPATVMR